MIDIIVMTKDDGYFLERCVNSIINTVSLDYRVVVVDNASSTELQTDILKILEAYPQVSVHRNSTNLWVLGLNNVLDNLYVNRRSDYFFLTDADIIFSNNISGEACWLSYIVNKMHNNICIGKLGFSLNWDILKNNKELAYILEQEESLYDEERKISDLYVSPVDTTAAIYRWDWSISGKYRFFPLHMTYLRPELYSCRTSKLIDVKHLGWELYTDKYQSSEKFDVKLINSKVLCFAIVAGDVKQSTLEKASLLYRILYMIIKRPMKVYWVLKRIYHGLVFYFMNSLRKYDNT